MGFTDRLQHAWNAFLNRDPTPGSRSRDLGRGDYYRPDRVRFSRGNERSIVTSVYNRIALDVAAISIKHVKLDDRGRYLYDVESGLNNCFNLEANVDQTGRAFVQDIVMSMLDEGTVAIVPVDTSIDPMNTGSYDILTMRTGKVVRWHPNDVEINLYNDRTGLREDITMPKRKVAIIENPLYSIINEPNSTMQRLVRKLNLLDAVDEQSSAGKLDLIVQLPYTIKTDARRQQAENRRKDIETQLTGSKYGIAYTDGTERITQLNRPVENNLMKQVEYLTSMLYSQLGITQTILDGTADDKTMLNYFNRTIEPFVSAIVDETKRKFLTQTARSQRHSILFFRDPFRLVPVSEISEIADKFTRNEIMSSNEIRQVIGLKPSDDPKADELRNKNINQPAEEALAGAPTQEPLQEPPSQEMTQEEYDEYIRDLDDLDGQLDELESEFNDELKHYASPYYDPVKAHEYYMRNRELKGRTSTSGLNEEGRTAAKYVKDQLTTERKGKVQSHKDQTNTQIDSLREQRKANVEAHKTQTQAKIDDLRAEIKEMSKEEKARYKDKIYAEIASLREENKQFRQSLSEEFKQASGSLRETHKGEKTKLKEEYDEKYVQELDKIKATAKFQKVSKAKKRY